ncbi:hypothetical protein [Aquabacterium sp.]|uniref:hypothetical protein n=1 Tax=Aquabacterium sp. TaxID=1872578 RepID=UPI0037847F5F
MNSHEAARTPSLLDWVDFKWLMATQGCRVDVERLQCDRGYAERCVALALASPSGLLRRLALKLQRQCASA